MNRINLLLITIALLLGWSQSYGQKTIDAVTVTGEVTDVSFCSHKNDTWIYQVKIKLHAKNVNTHPIIISSASALIYYYKIATSVENLKAMQFDHIGWITTGSQGDPKSVPDKPVKPFKVVAPNDSVEILTDLRLMFTSEPKYGPSYLQVIGENWPDYSKGYVSKIREAWRLDGDLWAHSLHSEPISFVLPPDLKESPCQ
jgi:hypothetical protein